MNTEPPKTPAPDPSQEPNVFEQYWLAMRSALSPSADIPEYGWKLVEMAYYAGASRYRAVVLEMNTTAMNNREPSSLTAAKEARLDGDLEARVAAVCVEFDELLSKSQPSGGN